MANQLGLSGGQPQKATRFAPIYTGRWSSGIWTNRSPLRDANTTRQAEKFYGPNGDALIAGSNLEVTNRLTLARRPGNPVFDANTYGSVLSFDQFRLFGPSTEQINVMVDEANALYSLYSGVKSLVWTKTAGAGQTYMQSVGNSLYFGNGEDNKKWLQTLNVWASGAKWGTATTPFLNTFLIDPNGNIQQLTSTVIPISTIEISSNVLNVVSSQALAGVLSVGLQIKFPTGMAASFLDGQTVTVTNVFGSTFTAAFTHANYGPTAETAKLATVVAGGTPISGTTQPAWNTTVPSSSNDFAGGTTVDGTVLWTNRGNPVENWGIDPPTRPVAPAIGTSRVAWAANTFYSLAGVIIDSNGNLQQVTVAGTSGASAPTWNTSVSGTTTDGTVTWTMIQTAASLVWQPGTAYAAGHFLVANTGTENCLFRLTLGNQPVIKSGLVNMYLWNSPHSGPVGVYILPNPTSTGTALASATGNSLALDQGSNLGANPAKLNTLNGAGDITGTTTPFPGYATDYMITFLCTLTVPAAGQYTFTINHHDGMIWGIGGNATKVAGPFFDPYDHTLTAVMGYPLMGGTNTSGDHFETFIVNFPAAGDYPMEIDYDFWYHSNQTMEVRCNSYTLCPGSPVSSSVAPSWPSWTTSYAPNYPVAIESSGQYIWQNLGPVADYAWTASVHYTAPNTKIIDSNGATQAPYRTGITGATAPTWQTGINQLTLDNPNLIWINEGTAISPPAGTLSTYNGGWKYAIALVNTLDDTVSNCTPLSAATGNFIGADGINIPAGSGLDINLIDPQCDYVAIFRTTDGLSTPFLIPGTGNSIYTIKLSDYLLNGYTDTTPDTGLDNLIQGAIAGENTPPLAGAVNLTYHLNRIFFSVGNVVYWTSGPDTPVGNGVNGVAPLNFDEFPSLVKRIVPCALGALVFTVSDVYLIQGQGTSSNPIQKGQPFLKNVGLLSYNALDINGSVIGLFTTDKQFIILDPTSGVSYVGFPIGDQLRQNDNLPGTAWNSANVYVTWHIDGEDQAWYVADGQYGWYRMMPTPSPDSGITWSPFATIVGGCKAVRSIEVSPGVHKLLLGPTTSGPLLNRDLTVFADAGAVYDAWGIIGSAVLAQPGQVAEVAFITTDSVNVGKPMRLGIIVDEAVPYFTGPFETLKDWESDPPTLPQSRSILGQRFYVSNLRTQAAVCRHLQIRVDWISENVQNELLSLTIFGAFNQEL